MLSERVSGAVRGKQIKFSRGGFTTRAAYRRSAMAPA